MRRAYAGPRHARVYRILNHDLKHPDCRLDVHATRSEIDRIATGGWIVRPRLFRGEALARLRRAVDRAEARERAVGRARATGIRRYGGVFIQDLLDQDPVFLEFTRTPALLSVARALLGPRVMAGLTARITMPGAGGQETHWHFHQRINLEPPAPFAPPHHKIDCLVYLDGLDDASGSLAVMPGSHRWERRFLPAEQYNDLPGQAVIRAPAGSAVLMHTNLWHRGGPNTPHGRRRRLLLLGYTRLIMDHLRPTRLPRGGVIERVMKSGDPELIELVGGATGYGEWSGNRAPGRGA